MHTFDTPVKIRERWQSVRQIISTLGVSFRFAISCSVSQLVKCDWCRKLLLITNRKSHTGFRLVPTSMTMNDPYFAFFHRIRQMFRPIVSQWLKINL